MKHLVIIFCLSALLPAAFAQTDDSFSLAKLDAVLHPAHDLIAEISITGFRDKTSSVSAGYRLFLSGRRKNIVLARTGKDANPGIAYLYKETWVRAYLPQADAFFSVPTFGRIDDTIFCFEDFLFPVFSKEYAVESSEQTTINTIKTPVLKIGLKAKERSARYPVLALFLDQKTGLVCSIEAYDDASHLVKTIRYSGFRAIGGSFIPTRILLIDALDNGAAALVTFNTAIAADIPDYVFTRPYIEYLSK